MTASTITTEERDAAFHQRWASELIERFCVACHQEFTIPRGDYFRLGPDEKDRCRECREQPGRSVTCPGCHARRIIPETLRVTPVGSRPVGWRFCSDCKAAGLAPSISGGVFAEPALSKNQPPPELVTRAKPKGGR